MVRRTGMLIAQFLVISVLIYQMLINDRTDPAYGLAGRNPTAAELERLQKAIANDSRATASYSEYLRSLVTLDLGRSTMTGESVVGLIRRTLPVTALLVIPAVLIGHATALFLAAVSARWRGRWPDGILRVAGMAGLSTSVLILLIVLQWVFASPDALSVLPARGWSTASLTAYLTHVALPSLVLVTLVVSVNLRFYRALVIDQLGMPHVVFAKRLGLAPTAILGAHVWPGIRPVVLTRVGFTFPHLMVGGAFVVESYFGVPGIGKVSFDALLSGDRPVAAAILALSSLAVLLAQGLTDATSPPSRGRVAL